MLEKLEPSEAGSRHVFLGKDKLKSNIGMNVLRQGKESYYALLDAGENWYEARRECEFLLAEERGLDFVITPLTGKNIELRQITLIGSGKSGAPFARYRLSMSMSAPETVRIKVEDLGFGELFPSTEQIWEQTFELP